MKRAEQQRQYHEQSAAWRRGVRECTAETAALEKTFSNIGDLLKTRLASASVTTQEAPLPAGTNVFFLNM